MGTSSTTAELMEEALCKKCELYVRGCTPYQVITCTEWFLKTIDKLVSIPHENLIKRKEISDACNQ